MTLRTIFNTVSHGLTCFLHHFEVYTCIECGKALPTEQILCRECRIKFIEEMRSPCSRCGAPQIECSCLSERKRHPFAHVMHIAPYRGTGVTHAMVAGCKTVRNLPLFRFVAVTTALEIKERLTIDANTILVPIPRAPRTVRNYGFDQALSIARYMADELGVPCVTALKRKNGKKQKSLGYRARMKNAREIFALTKRAADRLEDKHIILYDDVATTGASALACAKLLFAAGAASIDFVSFAKTER